MTTIYLIRHAEAEGNLYRIAQGQDNSSLTDRGWRQVRALEQRFANIHVDAVYSSDLYRACATASAIYKPKNLTLHRTSALREICVGEWEQRTWGDIYRLWPKQMECFNSQPGLWHVEGSEDPLKARERVLTAIRTIAAENDGKTVAVFSHGYVIRMTLAYLQGYPLDQIGKTPTGDNTSVALLEADGDNFRVIFRDDNSHLTTPEFLAEEKEVKRANGLEPGLWFRPLRLPEQADVFSSLVKSCWHDPVPFQQERLLADAAHRDTLLGYLAEGPVGLIQTGPEPGWISLACIRPDCRERSFGIQLIGQAVQHTRSQGGQTLSVALRPDSASWHFFIDCGFIPSQKMEDGRTILQMDIHFDPEYLGK